MVFHVPTMFAMVMVATMVLALSLAAIARRGHRELTIWAWALALQLMAHALLALRGQVSDLLSIIVANTLASLALALYAVGIHRFSRRPMPRLVVLLPVAVTAIGFSLMLGDYPGRLILGGVVMLGQSLYLFGLLWISRRRIAGRGKYLLMAAAAFYTLVMVWRLGVVAAGLPPSAGLTDPGPLSIVTGLAALAGTLLLTVGVLAMVFERAERRAIANEQRYRKLIDAAVEGIFVAENGRLRMVNPAMCRMMGVPEVELLGQPFLEFVHPEDRDRVAENGRKRLEGKADGVTYDARLLTRSNGVRWLRISGVAIEWQGLPGTLCFLADVTEQRAAADRIREFAFHDALTGLPNRRLFRDRLQQALAACARSGQNLAVVFIDLDHLKALNDLHGHAAGDQLLGEVARRLAQRLRESDTAARFGGDEFVLLITNLSPEAGEACRQGRKVVGELLASLAGPYVFDVVSDDRTVRVSHRCEVSAGIATGPHVAGGAGEPDALIARADAAMYRAKQAGRNRMVCDGDEAISPTQPDPDPVLPAV